MDSLCTQPLCDQNMWNDNAKHSFSIIVESSDGGREIYLEPGIYVVGRAEDCEINLNDRSVSRKHALLELDSDNICTVIDQGSFNGSLRNCLRLKSFVKYELRCDDRLQFGFVKCVFKTHTVRGSQELAEELTQLPNEVSKNKNSTGSDTEKNISSVTSKNASLSSQGFNDGCNQVEFVTEPNLSSPIAEDVTEIPDSSTVDDTDRDSATSVRLLADVILDSEDPLVSDLLPNPSQFFSRSPSPRSDHVNNETGSTVPKDVNVLIQETEMSESCSQSPVTRAQSEPPDLPNPTSSSISTGKMTTDSLPYSSVHGDAFCRPSFALVFSATPSQEAKATTEIPISRIPLARDSDPGLLCSAVDASYSHSSWTELLETQPALSSSIGPSVVCVEESRLFSNGMVHISHSLEQEDSILDADSPGPKICSSVLTKSTEPEITQKGIHIEIHSPSATQPMAAEEFDKGSLRSQTNLPEPRDIVDPQATHVDLESVDCFPELTQPMRQSELFSGVSVIQAPSDVHQGRPNSLVISSIHESPLAKNGKLRDDLRPTTPIANKITNTKNSIELNNQTSQLEDTSCVQSNLSEDLSELTQPMRQSATVEFTRNSTRQIDGDKQKRSKRLTSRTSSIHSSVTLSTPANDSNLVAEKRASCMTTAGITRRHNSTVTSCLILSRELGTVQFRSRRGRGRGRGRHKPDTNRLSVDNSAVKTDTLSSSSSCVNSVEDLQIADPSWIPIRRASTCFHSTADSYTAPFTLPLRKPIIRHRKATSRSGIPALPSPICLSGSLLSEDPSQLDDSTDVTDKILVNKPNELAVRKKDELTCSTERLIFNTASALQSPSALVLAGFEDSPEENGTKVSSVPCAYPCLSSFTDLSPEHCHEIAPPKEPYRPCRQTTRNSMNFSKQMNKTEPPAKRMRATESEQKLPVRRSLRRITMQTLTMKPEEFDQKIIKEENQTDFIDESASSSPLRNTRTRRQTRASMTVIHNKPETDTRKQSTTKGKRTNRLARVVHSSDNSFTSDPRRPFRSLQSSSQSTMNCVVVLDRKWNTPTEALFSGISATGFTKLLPHLSVIETDNVMTASLLISPPEVKRTRKVLYARARGIPLISAEWLSSCRRARKPPYPDPMDFVLHIPSVLSAKPGIGSCNRVLERRNSLSGEPSAFLFGWTLTCTPSVLPSPDDLAQLTNLSGGCWISSDRDLVKASSEQPPQVVIICDPKDVTADHNDAQRKKKSNSGITLSLQSALARAIHNLPCVSIEWFLQAVMLRQQPTWPIDEEFRLRPS